ncbi:MAG: guanylate kinase [Actinobacteria bacterium]|nr:MAG: guanylate kinase [Actinomycetota bacterium]
MSQQIFVIFGPGGAGKGTLEKRLLERFPDIWLSRSWTTRARRPNEAEDAYTFVDRETFEQRAREGGFVEWVEILPGQLSGTPTLDPPPGRDVLIEVDVRGAKMLHERYPDAVIIMVLPPSPEVLEARMRERGDSEDLIRTRREMAAAEEAEGREIADHVVVNDDLARALEELAGIVSAHHSQES